MTSSSDSHAFSKFNDRRDVQSPLSFDESHLERHRTSSVPEKNSFSVFFQSRDGQALILLRQGSRNIRRIGALPEYRGIGVIDNPRSYGGFVAGEICEEEFNENIFWLTIVVHAPPLRE